MTAAGVHRPTVPPGAASRHGVVGVRLTWLHLVSRRVPVALGLLTCLSALLGADLAGHWYIAGGPAAQQLVPLTIESGAAAIIAVTTYGPFGEPERATGWRLPCLRLGAVILLTAVAAGALAAAAVAGHLPGGSLAMVRNLAGLTGIGLAAAVAWGGAFGWTGPLAYLLVAEGALAGGWTTPWMWPTRPPHDLGAALCAALAFAAGAAAITVRGSGDRTPR